MYDRMHDVFHADVCLNKCTLVTARLCNLFSFDFYHRVRCPSSLLDFFFLLLLFLLFFLQAVSLLQVVKVNIVFQKMKMQQCRVCDKQDLCCLKTALPWPFPCLQCVFVPIKVVWHGAFQWDGDTGWKKIFKDTHVYVYIYIYITPVRDCPLNLRAAARPAVSALHIYLRWASSESLSDLITCWWTFFCCCSSIISMLRESSPSPAHCRWPLRIQRWILNPAYHQAAGEKKTCYKMYNLRVLTPSLHKETYNVAFFSPFPRSSNLSCKRIATCTQQRRDVKTEACGTRCTGKSHSWKLSLLKV